MNNRQTKKVESIRILSKELITSGISNKSYLINNEYVLRNKNKDRDPLNSLQNEYEIIKQLQNWPLSEKCISFNIKNGTKFSYYINDTHFYENPINKETLNKIASLIDSFHSLNLKSNVNFKPFKRINMYKKGCSNFIEENIEKDIINKSKKIYKKYPLITCHNDLVKGNILFKDEEIYLLDFEFTSKNIKLFDIASFLSENKILIKDIISYFISCFNVDICLDEVILIMNLQNILWYYWAQYNYLKTKKEIFFEIYNDKFKQLMFLLDNYN